MWLSGFLNVDKLFVMLFTTYLSQVSVWSFWRVWWTW